MFSFLSGTKPADGGAGAGSKAPDTLKEQVRGWQADLKREMREVERQIRSIEREEEKIKREAKEAARKGDPVIIKAIAKNIVMSRKAVLRLHETKAQLNSVSMTLQSQYAMQKVVGVVGKSTSIMKSMGRLINVPATAEAMRRMAAEMQKAGIVEEMMSDAMDAAEPDGLGDEADEVTAQVMYEITAGLMGHASSAPVAGLPAARKAPAAGVAAAGGAGRVAVAEGDAAAGGAGGDVDSLRDRLDKM